MRDEMGQATQRKRKEMVSAKSEILYSAIRSFANLMAIIG